MPDGKRQHLRCALRHQRADVEYRQNAEFGHHQESQDLWPTIEPAIARDFDQPDGNERAGNLGYGYADLCEKQGSEISEGRGEADRVAAIGEDSTVGSDNRGRLA